MLSYVLDPHILIHDAALDSQRGNIKRNYPKRKYYFGGEGFFSMSYLRVGYSFPILLFNLLQTLGQIYTHLMQNFRQVNIC